MPGRYLQASNGQWLAPAKMDDNMPPADDERELQWAKDAAAAVGFDGPVVIVDSNTDPRGGPLLSEPPAPEPEAPPARELPLSQDELRAIRALLAGG